MKQIKAHKMSDYNRCNFINDLGGWKLGQKRNKCCRKFLLMGRHEEEDTSPQSLVYND